MSPSNQQSVYSINALKTWNTHDGGGYQGNLLRDGKVVGQFHNDGNGGCTMVEFWKKEKGQVVRNQEEEALFEAHIASLPEQEWPAAFLQPGESKTYKPDTDMFIAELVEELENLRRLKRACSKKTLFLLKGDDPKEGWRTISHPWCEKVKAHLTQKYGDQIKEIANETLAASTKDK